MKINTRINTEACCWMEAYWSESAVLTYVERIEQWDGEIEDSIAAHIVLRDRYIRAAHQHMKEPHVKGFKPSYTLYIHFADGTSFCESIRP